MLAYLFKTVINNYNKFLFWLSYKWHVISYVSFPLCELLCDLRKPRRSHSVQCGCLSRLLAPPPPGRSAAAEIEGEKRLPAWHLTPGQTTAPPPAPGTADWASSGWPLRSPAGACGFKGEKERIFNRFISSTYLIDTQHEIGFFLVKTFKKIKINENLTMNFHPCMLKAVWINIRALHFIHYHYSKWQKNLLFWKCKTVQDVT